MGHLLTKKPTIHKKDPMLLHFTEIKKLTEQTNSSTSMKLS